MNPPAVNFISLHALQILLLSHSNQNRITEEIIQLCKNTLPDYEVPVDIEYIESMPITAANKVDFKALEKQADER